MILEDQDIADLEVYLHLERYVNRGSPSGFSDVNTTSPGTSAKGSERGFHLPSVEFPSTVECVEYGLAPSFLPSGYLPLHPDMMSNDSFKRCTTVNREFRFVSPTASERTVMDRSGDGWFYKLSYNELIGRAPRLITTQHAQSAVEVTSFISSAIQAQTLPRGLYFMRETFGRVFKVPNSGRLDEWGVVLREPRPYPHEPTIKLLLPAFAAFSKDSQSPNDALILHQLYERQSKSIEDFLFEDLIAPVYDCYFSLLQNCGMQIEAHAQNIMFALDGSLQIRGVVIRDAESVDKDFSLIETLGLAINPTETDYKCLRLGQYNYHIMHSFMFDFKLGEYLVSPLIECAADKYDVNRSTLVERIKKHNATHLEKLPHDFFPSDSKWYSYENVVHTPGARRQYTAHDCPKYRFT
ncbi:MULTISPECIES: IucA/IucC family protein [unclassified Bradyrhizobium]|uniref:IucA/IucC family protein n=1 Tax=unclassified Bradyrhizobium TaxID=2631580 RepID=UPI002916F983|nr:MULTISPECIES: IucA/IucC family protein [unclassified Bradyrhizobium]